MHPREGGYIPPDGRQRLASLQAVFQEQSNGIGARREKMRTDPLAEGLKDGSIDFCALSVFAECASAGASHSISLSSGPCNIDCGTVGSVPVLGIDHGPENPLIQSGHASNF
jgi:hypothetical protein